MEKEFRTDRNAVGIVEHSSLIIFYQRRNPVDAVQNALHAVENRFGKHANVDRPHNE